jgi:hypothetical protein
LQDFHKKGGDINGRDGYATPARRSHFSSGRKCSEHCPLALPYLAENKCFGANLYTLTPFSLGATPPGPPDPFWLFFPLHAQLHLCRVPLVHAAAAWHRDYEWTPLMHAARFGSTAALKLLVQLRADLDAQCNIFG